MYLDLTTLGEGEVSVGDTKDSMVEKTTQQHLKPVAAGMCRVVCLADTHCAHNLVDVPDGDVLVLAGDILLRSRLFSTTEARRQLNDVAHWLHNLPGFKGGKLVIGGNHDVILEEIGVTSAQEIFADCTYLEDSGVVVAGGALAAYGSPLSTGTSKNKAFQSDLGSRTAGIPKGVDLLVTHGPLPESVIQECSPRIHVWGHLHAQYGCRRIPGCRTISVCASVMDKHYNPVQLPWVIDLPLVAARL